MAIPYPAEMVDAETQAWAEMTFLRERFLHGDETWVGASSDALLEEALTGKPTARWPADSADLRRCEETYRRAPRHLQERMIPTLDRFQWRLKETYPAYRLTPVDGERTWMVELQERNVLPVPGDIVRWGSAGAIWRVVRWHGDKPGRLAVTISPVDPHDVPPDARVTELPIPTWEKKSYYSREAK